MVIVMRDPKKRRAALIAAATLSISVCIIPLAAYAVFITHMAHQYLCPCPTFRGVSPILGVSALVAAIGCPGPAGGRQ
jgi:hypothetical protein